MMTRIKVGPLPHGRGSVGSIPSRAREQVVCRDIEA
jgi:hypothetical protein